jgi:hypothetical protein
VREAREVQAWKFLDRRCSTVFSAFEWTPPAGGDPGPWVEAAGPVDGCRTGVHACRVADLPWWLSDQLFEIELDGAVFELDRKLVAPRGRLVRRVDAWADGGAKALAEASGWRARELAVWALRRGGRDAEAERLSTIATLADLEAEGAAVAAALAGEPAVVVAVGLAADGAHYALVGEPEQAPFVAACAAGHAGRIAGGDGAYRPAFEEERRAQAAWLAERLDLT